jgi:N-acetyltransferase
MRKHDIGDDEVLYAVAADPLIWEQHPLRDRFKEEVFQQFYRDALESGGTLIVIDKKDGRVIGSSRFHGYNAEQSEVEIGWTFLARSHWGGVYNGDIKQLMLRHAFQFVEKVIFLIAPQNIRSQKAVEKIGAVRTTRSDPKASNNVVYEITLSEFAKQTGRNNRSFGGKSVGALLDLVHDLFCEKSQESSSGSA